MDVTFNWVKPIDNIAASLFAAINVTYDELQQSAFATWGRAKRVSCDVYAHVDNLVVLATCSEWKPTVAFDLNRPQETMSVLMGTMGDINIHRDRIMGAHVIRLVATFDVNDDTNKTLYGNVRLSPDK